MQRPAEAVEDRLRIFEVQNPKSSTTVDHVFSAARAAAMQGDHARAAQAASTLAEAAANDAMVLYNATCAYGALLLPPITLADDAPRFFG